MLTGLFDDEELLQWRPEEVLRRHGNETFYADDTRGNYAHPKLGDYVQAQRNERMIFVSDTLRGAFGRAWRFARRARRRKLWEDFAERPIFSVGVRGGAVPRHDGHPETWHALLSGIKAWWLQRPPVAAGAAFEGWEDPCGAIESLLQAPEPGVKLCVQHAGEVLYFGDDMEHSTCGLSAFSLAVGAQGHTETWPALLRVANRGDLKEVQQLLSPSPGLAAALRQRAGRYGHSAVHRAALHGHAEVVRELLRARAELSRDDEGLSPSFLAAFSGHVKVLKTLGENAVAERDGKGASPLQWAATQGHLAVVDFLLSRRGDVRATNTLGGGALSAAATTGQAEVVRRLVAARGNMEETDHAGMQPLHWASLHGHLELLRLLLELRASPAKDRKGKTPLDLAQGAARDLLRARPRIKASGNEL